MEAVAHWSKQSGWVQVVMIQLCAESNDVMGITAHRTRGGDVREDSFMTATDYRRHTTDVR
jgi:hypothetical protein